MSRYRSNSSTSPIDQEIQQHVVVAERAIQAGMAVLNRARKLDSYSKAHLARVRRDLERALGAISSVRRVNPSYDTLDPDLQSTAPYEPAPHGPATPLLLHNGDLGLVDESQE